MQMILQKSVQKNCQKPIAGVLDFPVLMSVSQENDRDYRENALDYFLKLSDFLKKQKKKINPNGCSLKMLEICCQAKKDLILQKYSLHWIRSGMMQNGRCWTVPISEYHSTEKGSILLDILEQKAEK